MSQLVSICVTAIVNGAVMWGVVSTKLDWLRADVDRLDQRVAHMERKP